VNGDDLHQATHEKAIMSLTQSTTEVHLVVRHDPQPDGFQVSYTTNHQVYSALYPSMVGKLSTSLPS